MVPKSEKDKEGKEKKEEGEDEDHGEEDEEHETCHEPKEIDEWLKASSIETWIIQKKVDMNKYFEEPTYRVMKIMDKRLLGIDFVDATVMELEQVEVGSEISWFAIYGDPTFQATYYNVHRILAVPENHKLGGANEHTIIKTNIYLESLKKVHERSVYGIIDLLGDLGGVLEVIMVFTGVLLFPISEHHFVLQATKRMFLARSKNSKELFQDNETANEERNQQILDIIKDKKSK